MNQLRIILLAVVSLSFSFFAIISSCKKDKCKGITCLNSGTCSDGNCNCPAGYTGSRCETDMCAGVTCLNAGHCENSKCKCATGYFGVNCENADSPAIAYRNNAFTPVTIVINGFTQVIAPGAVVGYKRAYGTIAEGSASTSGSAGAKIIWNILDTFLGSGQIKNIDVGPDYFFMKIGNGSDYNTLSMLYVNYGLPDQTLDGIDVPNTSWGYVGIGYYKAFTNSNLRIVTGSEIWSSPVTLPFTTNQSFTYLAD